MSFAGAAVPARWRRIRLVAWALLVVSVLVVEPGAVSAAILAAAITWGGAQLLDGRVREVLEGVGDVLGATIAAAVLGISVSALAAVLVIASVAHGWFSDEWVGGIVGLFSSIAVLSFTRLLAMAGATSSPDGFVLLFGVALGSVGGILARWRARNTGHLFEGVPVGVHDLPFAIWWFRDGRIVSQTEVARRLTDDPVGFLRLPPVVGSIQGQEYGQGGPGRVWAWALWRWTDAQDGQSSQRAVVLATATEGDLSPHIYARARQGASALLADLAHELKNPAAIIRTSTEMLRDESALDPYDRMKLIDRAAEASARLVALLGGVGALGRLAGGEVTAVSCDAISNRLSLIASDHGASLLWVPPVLSESYKWDEQGAMLCLENLVRNASQEVGPAGGQVRVEGALSGGAAVFRVSDSGPGLPGDCLPLEGTMLRTSRHGGQGLGLGLAVRTAGLIGGSLRYDRDEGDWAFVLTVPLLSTTDVAGT